MEKYKNKIDDMTNEDLKNELEKVRNDVQYLGEKIDRKRSWRDRLIRECWKRGIFKSPWNEGALIVPVPLEPTVGD